MIITIIIGVIILTAEDLPPQHGTSIRCCPVIGWFKSQPKCGYDHHQKKMMATYIETNLANYGAPPRIC